MNLLQQPAASWTAGRFSAGVQNSYILEDSKLCNKYWLEGRRNVTRGDTLGQVYIGQGDQFEQFT